MKCSRCENRAVIRLRYAKLALCEKHLVEYIRKKVRNVVKKALSYGLPPKIVVAVSGGKDSMVLLHTMKAVARDLGIEVRALYIDLGIEPISSRARRIIEEACSNLGIDLITVNVLRALGESIPGLSKRFRKSYCATCGIVKRYIMNAVGVEYGSIVATGHHLDDIVTYIVKELIVVGGDVRNIKVSDVIPPAPGACPRIRPLIKLSEREIMAYAIVEGVEYVRESCPYAPRKPIDATLKNLISILESRYPGTKLGILSRYSLRYSDLKRESSEAKTCVHCGLISLGNECALCRHTRVGYGRALGPQLREYIRSIVRDATPLRQGSS